MIVTDPKATILIVDDNPTNLSVLFEYLNRAHLKVVVAQDGPSALERIHYIVPDLILLDVRMPGMDGFETLRRLKKIEKVKDIPVIFMTALSDVVDEVKGLEIGAVDYIAKPVQGEKVLARINTQLMLRNLQKDLEEKNAELDAFAHTVAHDLKAPLALIMGYIELIVQDSGSLSAEELQVMAESIYRNGRKLDNIINELLLFSTVGKGEVELAPLLMADIVAQVQARLAYMFGEYKGKIILPDEWPVAQGYAPWIEEVWANYLSNGLKYGGQPPRLELGATPQKDGLIRFWVKDNGPGIDPKIQAKLFKEFTHLSAVRVEGHGLGLSITRRIVEKLGGQVGVESEPEKGSLFYFTLPAGS
ncbi:MAG: hybrid sensor histidine kinase/response regulator [Anaerolineaceae bacterium]|nr:hybrid sensor histidine kinase/response regulator [Anaerolineaceae bacterium]